MNKTEMAQARLNAVCDAHEYYIHECYNGNECVCDAIYKVTRKDYLRFDEIWPYDCFNEIDRKRFECGCWTHYTTEHHLYLDYGDCDDPDEVVTMHYDWSM